MALTALLNLISTNATQQGSSDRITGTEMRAILNAIVNTLQGDVSFSTAIPFDKAVSKMTTHQMVANITLTPKTTGAVGGFGAVARIIGGGSYTVALSGFKKSSASGSFVAASGAVNVFLFLYDGTDYWYSVFQEAGTSSGTTPVQLSTPGSFAASASGTDVNLSWADVANESSYLIEVSDNGSTGWSTLASKAAGSTSHTHNVGVNSTTKYYRIKAVGNGSTYTDSAYATANATTAAATSYDADLTAWTTANGITGTQKDAYNTLVTGLKSAGLWAKGRGFWHLGTDLNTSKFNLFNPAQELTYSGSGTFAADGFTNGGSGAVGLNTGIANNTNSGVLCFGISVKTNYSGVECDFGVLSGANPQWYILSLTSGQTWAKHGERTLQPSNANGIGRYYSTGNSSECSLYKNGSQLGTTLSAAIETSANTFVIGNGGGNLVSGRKLSTAWVFDHLTASEISALDGLIANLETDLGR